MYQYQEPTQAQIEGEYFEAGIDIDAVEDNELAPRNKISLVVISGNFVGFWRTDGLFEVYNASEWQLRRIVGICLKAGLEYSIEIDHENTITLSFWRA